ncbi:MAG: TetR/AcrR family transcriptional regulator [Actinomycetia bacterium]|nr:TetR/AcrR family transcriptional regulator [Actinomycetes bacterium]
MEAAAEHGVDLVEPSSINSRRTHILNAARTVFADRGSLDAGMREIATRAGCTTGAIYSVFSGKEDIYAVLLGQSLDDLTAAVSIASARHPDAVTSLRAAASAFLGYYLDHEFEYKLGLHQFHGGQGPDLDKHRDQELNAKVGRVIDVFEAGFTRVDTQRPPAGHNPRDRAEALFMSLIGVFTMVHTRRVKSVGVSPDAVVETLLDTFCGPTETSPSQHLDPTKESTSE